MSMSGIRGTTGGDPQGHEIVNVIGYTRVSSEDQAHYGLSLGVQSERIKDYCRARNFNLVTIFSDEGISASKKVDRPGYNKVMKCIENPKINGLIVTDHTRFNRKKIEFMSNYETLQEHKTFFVDISNPVFSTEGPQGEFMRTITIAYGQMETDQISERVSKVLESMITNGKWCGGRCPTGYTFHKEIVDTPEGPRPKVTDPWLVQAGKKDKVYKAVKMVFSLKLQGKSLNYIHEATGISRRTINKMLHNPTYTGLLYRNTKNKGTVIVEGKHKGYISIKTFNEIQILMRKKEKRPPKGMNKNRPIQLIKKTNKGYVCYAHTPTF